MVIYKKKASTGTGAYLKANSFSRTDGFRAFFQEEALLDDTSSKTKWYGNPCGHGLKIFCLRFNVESPPT